MLGLGGAQFLVLSELLLSLLLACSTNICPAGCECVLSKPCEPVPGHSRCSIDWGLWPFPPPAAGLGRLQDHSLGRGGCRVKGNAVPSLPIFRSRFPLCPPLRSSCLCAGWSPGLLLSTPLCLCICFPLPFLLLSHLSTSPPPAWSREGTAGFKLNLLGAQPSSLALLVC